MGAIVDKHEILFNDNEKTNNIKLEEETNQQMKVIKREDLDVVPLVEVRNNLDKKYCKVVDESKINEIGEVNIEQLESNLVNKEILKLKHFGESSRNLDMFQQEQRPSFLLGLSEGEQHFLEESNLTPSSQTDYILNINETYNSEEIFEH